MRLARDLTKKNELIKVVERRLTKEHQRKWKKFSKMTEEEKRERIKYLWRRARIFVKSIGYIKTVQRSMESHFLDQFA